MQKSSVSNFKSFHCNISVVTRHQLSLHGIEGAKGWAKVEILSSQNNLNLMQYLIVVVNWSITWVLVWPHSVQFACDWSSDD
jgi:hypothetical protein